MVSVRHLVDGEEDVSDVEGNVSAYFRIEDDIAHCAFPHPVEVDSDQVAVGVDHRTS